MLDALDPSPAEVAAARVVVVDDEPLVTETLRTFLDLELDITAHAFNDPTRALEHIQTQEVDLVISDFLMPQMDGIHFLREVRQQQPVAPRILLTGYADKQNAIHAINQARLFQYVEKPWDNDRLRSVVLRALRQCYLVRRLAEHLTDAAETRPGFAGLTDDLYSALS